MCVHLRGASFSHDRQSASPVNRWSPATAIFIRHLKLGDWPEDAVIRHSVPLSTEAGSAIPLQLSHSVGMK